MARDRLDCTVCRYTYDINNFEKERWASRDLAVSHLRRDLSSRVISPKLRVDTLGCATVSFTIHETFIMLSIIIIVAVWGHASVSETLLLLFWTKFQRSAKVSACLKQLVTYVAGTCGGDKVSEFARRLHVAIYKAKCHPTNRRLRISLDYFFNL